jgi:hypothetical protein
METKEDTSRAARRWLGPWAAALAWSAAAAHLGGGIALLQFLLLIGGVVLPLTALAADVLRPAGLGDELSACASAVLAIVCTVPAFYVRRLVPIPHLAFDLLIAALVLALSIRSGALRRLGRVASSPVFRAAGWLLALVVPLVLCLVWMGFEVRGEGVVRYYGLFPIDFANLSNVITMMKASPGLPLFASAGSGYFFYHWWYYALPAWLTDFAGLSCRNTTALCLSNLLTASCLVACLCAVIARELAGNELSARARRSAIALSAAVVCLAPFSVYAYQFMVAHLHLHWFTLGVRNSLMLTIVNSMATFGNNTLALVAVASIVAAVGVWNERPSIRLAAVIAVLSVAVAGLSVTMVFPLALALGAWFVIGGVRSRGLLLAGAIPVGVIGLLALRFTHVLGGSGEGMVIAFDHATFLQNVTFAMAPVWVLVLAAVRAGSVGRRSLFPALLILTGILVPSFVLVRSVRADPSVMSMKVASMLVVAAAPLVADGVVALMTKPLLVWRATAALAVAVGLTNALVYAGQFAFNRALHRPSDRVVELPAAYVDALDYVRRETPENALVVDPSSNLMRATISTLLVAERRVWLPTPFGAEVAGVDATDPRIRVRADVWRAWERGGFSDESIAAAIAREADVIVGPPTIKSASWHELRAFDGYAIYAASRFGERRVE